MRDSQFPKFMNEKFTYPEFMTYLAISNGEIPLIGHLYEWEIHICEKKFVEFLLSGHNEMDPLLSKYFEWKFTKNKSTLQAYITKKLMKM